MRCSARKHGSHQRIPFLGYDDSNTMLAPAEHYQLLSPLVVVVRRPDHGHAGVVGRTTADHAGAERSLVLAARAPVVGERQRARVEQIRRPGSGRARAVVGARLDQADMAVGILREPRRHDAPRGAASYDGDVDPHPPSIRRPERAAHAYGRPYAPARRRGLRSRGGIAHDALTGHESLVRARVRDADARAGARVAGDRGGRRRARPGSHRLGEDARRVPPRTRPPERDAGARPPAPLRLAAQGAQLRRRAEPPRPARRAPLDAVSRRPHGRHAAARPRADAPHAARHPDHDARVALPAPHLARPRAPEDRRDRDPRRGARGRRHEARRAPRALARAARARRRAALPAHRPLGHPAAAGRDRPLGRRARARDRARRRGAAEGARPRGRRPRRGHA